MVLQVGTGAGPATTCIRLLYIFVYSKYLFDAYTVPGMMLILGAVLLLTCIISFNSWVKGTRELGKW